MSKDTAVSSVELELQQLLSALEKHQKHEDGTGTSERQGDPTGTFQFSVSGKWF
jgi:hypothetical protein